MTKLYEYMANNHNVTLLEEDESAIMWITKQPLLDYVTEQIEMFKKRYEVVPSDANLIHIKVLQDIRHTIFQI